MTLVQLVQQVCLELGITPPGAVTSSADPQIRQLYALLNRHGHDLCRSFEWERLDKEYLITTVAFQKAATTVQNSPVVTMADTSSVTTNFGIMGYGVAPFALVQSVDSSTQITMNMSANQSGSNDLTFAQVAYPLPSDWLKQIPQTEWDRTNRWPMLGPKSPQEWQSFKSGIVYVGPRERFRIQGNAFQVNPPPPNNLAFAFEYISNAWVLDGAGNPKSSLSQDTDSWIYDDSLLVSGLKLRWKQAKGLDYSFENLEYSQLLQQLKAQDKSAPKLSLSMTRGSVLLSGNNVISGEIGGGGSPLIGQDSNYILSQQ